MPRAKKTEKSPKRQVFSGDSSPNHEASDKPRSELSKRRDSTLNLTGSPRWPKLKSADPPSTSFNIPNRPDKLSDEDDGPLLIGKKRPCIEDGGDGMDFSSEMHKMLEGFGADISKTLEFKRKRLEVLTQNSLKTNNKKIEEVWKMQQQARTKLQEEYGKQVYSVFQQWEADIEKTREEEEKLNALFKQQQKLFQQARIVQSQRLKTVRQLSEQFLKGLEDLENNHKVQQLSVQSELKKEMTLLQKKILMNTQQQDMANVKKSLHSMLF